MEGVGERPAASVASGSHQPLARVLLLLLSRPCLTGDGRGAGANKGKRREGEEDSEGCSSAEAARGDAEELTKMLESEGGGVRKVLAEEIRNSGVRQARWKR